LIFLRRDWEKSLVIIVSVSWKFEQGILQNNPEMFLLESTFWWKRLQVVVVWILSF
jgi:hypothetical protein